MPGSDTVAPAGGSHFQNSHFFVPAQLPLPGEAIFRNLTDYHTGFLEKALDITDYHTMLLGNAGSDTVAHAGGSHFQKSTFFVPTQLPLPGEAIFRIPTFLFLHSCPCRGKPFSEI